MGNPRVENAPWFMMTVAILPRALKVIFDSCSQQDQFKQKHKPKICNAMGLSFTCSVTYRIPEVGVHPCSKSFSQIWQLWQFDSSIFYKHAQPAGQWLCPFPKNSLQGTINWRWHRKFQNSKNAVSANWSFPFFLPASILCSMARQKVGIASQLKFWYYYGTFCLQGLCALKIPKKKIRSCKYQCECSLSYKKHVLETFS